MKSVIVKSITIGIKNEYKDVCAHHYSLGRIHQYIDDPINDGGLLLEWLEGEGNELIENIKQELFGKIENDLYVDMDAFEITEIDFEELED